MSSEIPGLDPSAALTGAEVVHVVQGGNSRRTTTAAVAALAAGLGGGGGGSFPASRAALALAPKNAPAFLLEDGREGQFLHFTAAEFLAEYGLALAGAIAADTLQGIYVATDTGAWVRQGDTITPFMFGGVTNYKTGSRTTMIPPYGESATPGSIDLVLVDSRAACQAVLDMVAFHTNRVLVGDFSGGLWGITARGDGGAHDLDGLVIDQKQEYGRRFIGGEFRGIGAGRHLIYVDEGAYSKFEGIWHVRSGADGGSSYGWNIRQWETGIWLRNSAMSRWDLVKASGFKRWGLEFDPEYSDADYNNNIGARIARFYGNNNGSCFGRAGFEFTIDWTASNRTGAAGGFAQRTNLTLAATGTGGHSHDVLRVGDIIRSPAGSYHRIEEKVGNVISVFPWIISQAAAGTITSCHGGAIRIRGKDVAGAGADHITGITNGWTLDITETLHGTDIGSVIQEGGGGGLLIGTINGIDLGHTIGKMHSEGNQLDLLSIGLGNSELVIGACSAWAGQDYNDPFKLTEALAPNDGAALAVDYALPQVGIFIGGEWLTSGVQHGNGGSTNTRSRAYAPSISNNPNCNRLRKVQAAGAPTNLTLKYYDQTDRFLRDAFVAELEISGLLGGAPGSAITVTLDAADVAAGIQFANGTTASTYVVAAGEATGPVRLEFWLDTNGATKRWIVVEKAGLAGGVKTLANAAEAGVIGHANRYLRFTNAAATTYTVPTNATAAFPIGTVIELEQAGAGALTIAGAVGVTINGRGSDLTLAGQYAVAALKKVAADTWTLTGDL